MGGQKGSGRGGRWKKHSIFIYSALDEDGSGNKFETSQSKTDTPTLCLSTTQIPKRLRGGKITRIQYRLKPTNAVTFILRLWRSSSVPDYECNQYLLYESPPLQASDEDYDRVDQNIPFRLYYPGKLYYSIEWSGAPGNTCGFITVTGEVVE